jgi:hypothetical protein
VNSAKKLGPARRKQIKTAPVQPRQPASVLLPWTQRQQWTVLAYLFGLLPICLLWHGNNAFFSDWNNHLWGIGYYGEYFRRHWTFPLTLNTHETAGMPYPVFYGYLFYPAAGLISSVTGSSFALRLVCSLGFLFQVWQVNKTLGIIAGNRFVACVITTLVSFATYPLTNLYNRAAITEFIAASLIVSVSMMWLRIIQMQDPSRRRRLIFRAFLALAFALGTHPITAILGGGMVLLLIIAALPFRHHSRDLWKTLVAACGLIAIVMAPWAYAVAQYGSKVQLSQVTRGWVYVFATTIDSLMVRFSPIPSDPRMGTPVFAKWGTPYLDTQINFALLILALYLLYRAVALSGLQGLRRVYFPLGALAGFALVCITSVSEQFWLWVPDSLKFIQFSYRLVTYADLFLLFAVLLLLTRVRKLVNSPDHGLTAVLTICLALSIVSVTVKMTHAYRAEEPNTLGGSGWPDTNRKALLSLPSTFYGVAGYAMNIGSAGTLPSGKPAIPAFFPLGTGDRFGDVLPLSISSNPSGLIQTNVQIFPWNHVAWNGHEIPFEKTFTTPDLTTVIAVQPGAGKLEYIFRPDPIWLVLHFLSLWTAALWTVAACLPRYYFRTRNT